MRRDTTRIIMAVLAASFCLLLFSCENSKQNEHAADLREDFPNTQPLPEGDTAFCAVASSLMGMLEGSMCFRGESQYYIHTADVPPAKVEKGLVENVPWKVDWEGARKTGLAVIYLFGGEKLDTAKAFLYAQIQPIPENVVESVNPRETVQHITDAQVALIFGEKTKSYSQKYVTDESDFIDPEGRVFAVRTINEGIFLCGKVRIGFFVHNKNLLTYTLCSNDKNMEIKTIPVFEDMMERTAVAK